MKGLENQEYLIGFLAFNVLALIFVFVAIKWPRIGRLLFFLLFAWACWMNWTFSQNDPAAYQEYAELTFFDFYKQFITGWFSQNTVWVVATIATCQGLIAISMLLKGSIYKLGCIGGIVFLLSIAPLGVGSGFPCTISFAIALFLLYKKGKAFLWAGHKRPLVYPSTK
jgi:hypothetical protein